jgi:hypothetical protein
MSLDNDGNRAARNATNDEARRRQAQRGDSRSPDISEAEMLRLYGPPERLPSPTEPGVIETYVDSFGMTRVKPMKIPRARPTTAERQSKENQEPSK